jgi:hypothetical protein
VRYIVHHAWPVQGGSVIIPGETTIDTSQPGAAFLIGVVPPPDSTPLDQEAVDMLRRAYSAGGDGSGRLRI